MQEVLAANAYYVENFSKELFRCPARSVTLREPSRSQVALLRTSHSSSPVDTLPCKLPSSGGHHPLRFPSSQPRHTPQTSHCFTIFTFAIITSSPVANAHCVGHRYNLELKPAEEEGEAGQEATFTAILRTLSPAYVGLYLLDLPPNVKPWSTDKIDPIRVC